MKKIIIVFVLMTAQSIFAQDNQGVSIFHRLLIYNTKQEVMIVKFKDTDIWVTPGFYQDNKQYIKKGLHSVAADYGLSISNPKLKGVFSMGREFIDRNELSIRSIYRCDYLKGKVKLPESIGEVKWLSVEKAVEAVTYKSIKLFLEQTDTYPNVVWGGSVLVIRKGPESDYKIIEEFYPLFDAK